MYPSRALDSHARRPFGHERGHAPKGIPRRAYPEGATAAAGRPGALEGGGDEGVPPIETLSVCYGGRVEGHLIQQALGSRIAAATKYEGDVGARVLLYWRLRVAFVPFRGLERQRRSSDGDDDIDIATVTEGSKSEEIDLHACIVKNK